MPNLTDRLFVLFQRLLPHRLLGRLVHRVSRARTRWLKNALIRGFVRLFGVDLSEAADPAPGSYPHLNAFFTRPLRPGARPIDATPGAVVSPADGRLDQAGFVSGHSLLQAKRYHYTLADLLAVPPEQADAYEGGPTMTVYLAPHDYHRVHLPLAARVTAMSYVPGHRWAVNARTVRTLPGLFSANERVILWCRSAAGPYVLVLVGAMNVASMSVPWAGEVVAPGPARWDYSDRPLEFGTGDLVGQFNLGSTVIVVGSPRLWTWRPGLEAGVTVRMGEGLGRLETTP